jgi:pantoate--beta-alanine ligase
MKILKTARECAEFAGCHFVPTMGALHEGHRALMRAALSPADAPPPVRPLVVSIFVNPTQFGPSEDFSRYPRDEERDLEICRDESVDAVFLPSVEEVYPPGFLTVVCVPGWNSVLCGKARPGHFDGVTTVVARLFGLIKPSAAWFGWKDAQQLLIIRRMAADLALGVRIEAVETVREADGLACSSRNAYLAPDERALAAHLYRALRKGEECAREGGRASEVVGRVKRHLAVSGLAEEYVELRRIADFAEVELERSLSRSAAAPGGGGYLLAAAVRVGRARLIDNVRIFADKEWFP